MVAALTLFMLILDFGLAQLNAPLGRDATTTVTIEPGQMRTLAGTFAFMAPEQIRKRTSTNA
jgi:serine/threonine protein kinase